MNPIEGRHHYLEVFREAAVEKLEALGNLKQPHLDFAVFDCNIRVVTAAAFKPLW
jgi:hypothetical protein